MTGCRYINDAADAEKESHQEVPVSASKQGIKSTTAIAETGRANDIIAAKSGRQAGVRL